MIRFLITAIIVLTTGYSISEDDVDLQKIYYGSHLEFETPGEVDLESLMRETPEVNRIKSKRIETGSAKYWILISKATDRCMNTIYKYCDKTEYDFVTSYGYLDTIDESIGPKNITGDLVKFMKDCMESE